MAASTIIQRNIQQLGLKFLESVNYKDIDYRGYISTSADPTVQSGAVLVNDAKLWIQSTTGDYYRRLAMGGFFDDIRRYPLTDSGASSLKADFITAYTQNFPTVQIIELNITPDVVHRSWVIALYVQDTITKAVAAVTTAVAATN